MWDVGEMRKKERRRNLLCRMPKRDYWVNFLLHEVKIADHLAIAKKRSPIAIAIKRSAIGHALLLSQLPSLLKDRKEYVRSEDRRSPRDRDKKIADRDQNIGDRSWLVTESTSFFTQRQKRIRTMWRSPITSWSRKEDRRSRSRSKDRRSVMPCYWVNFLLCSQTEKNTYE